MRPMAVSGSPDGLGSVAISGSIVGAVLVAGLLWYLSTK